MALAAYRQVLRSTRIAFEGDVRLAKAARQQARQGFDAGRWHSPSGPEAVAGIQHAQDVARILRQNVVQGQKVPEGGDRYQLRIHDEIERGDNETIKMAGKNIEEKSSSAI